jgi:hypothetical protein
MFLALCLKMVTATYAHARLLIQPTKITLFTARLMKKLYRRCAVLALPMVNSSSATVDNVLLLILSLVPRCHLHVSHTVMSTRS